MKNSIGYAGLVLIAGSSLGGCHLAHEIFHLGVWSGVLMVVIVLALVGGLISFFRS